MKARTREASAQDLGCLPWLAVLDWSQARKLYCTYCIAFALVPWLVAISLALQWLPVLQGLWPATALLSVIGLPAAAQLIQLLRDHHDQPERVTGSKFLALRFQVLSGLGLAIGLGIAPLLGW